MILFAIIMFFFLLSLLNYRKTGRDEDGFLLCVMAIIMAVLIFLLFNVNSLGAMKLETAKINEEKIYIEMMLEKNRNEYWESKAKKFNIELEIKKKDANNLFYGMFINKGCLEVDEIEIRK